MTGQHTPGNWIAFQTENQANVGQWSIGLEHSNPICHGVGKNDAYMLISGVCSEVDARLFAAAPELLTACESMVPARCCLTNPNIPDSTVVPMEATMGELRALAAAIAKARGQ